MVDVGVIGTAAAGSKYDLLAQVFVVHVSPKIIGPNCGVKAVWNRTLESGVSGLVRMRCTVSVCVSPEGRVKRGGCVIEAAKVSATRAAAEQ